MNRGIASLLAFLAFGTLVAGIAISDEISDKSWLGILALAWVFLLGATRFPLSTTLPTFNRSVIRTSLVIGTVFILISAQLVRIQVVQSDETFHRVAVAPNGETLGNPRLANGSLVDDRGEIFDRNGNLIAGTRQDGNIYLRYYPDPATAYVAGYYSPLIYGASGLERSYNDVLTGKEGGNAITRTTDQLLNRPTEGSNLVLTLDADLQQYGTDLLGSATGSVVIMDVKTGAVLTLVSNPNYDPNQLFTSSSAESEDATAYWESLIKDPSAPLVIRPTIGIYTPGSTFKTVTAAIGIDGGYVSPDDIYEDNGELNIDGRILVENNRPDDSQDQWTVREGLAWSLNVVFAQIGLEIGPNDMWTYTQNMGFGSNVPFDLETSTNSLASDRDFLDNRNALADTAFGQGQIQVTPLFMAMITSMYCNGGQMMEPYLVQSVTDDNGKVLSTTDPKVWKSPIKADTANDVQSMMINAVENGSVSRAQAGGYTVGGKTGTAETGDGGIQNWFIGFIGEDDPQYAVAVVLETGNDDQSNATDIGRDMLVRTMEQPTPDSSNLPSSITTAILPNNVKRS